MKRFALGFVVIVSLLHFISGKYSLTVLLQKYDVGMGYLYNGSHCNPFWYSGIKCNIQLKMCVSLLSDSASIANCQNQDGNPSNQWIDLGIVTNNSNSVEFGLSKYNNWANPFLIASNDPSFTGFSLSLEAYNVNGNEVNLIDSYTYQFANGSDVSDFNFYTHERNNSLLDPTLTQISWKVDGDVTIPSTPTPVVEGVFDCNDLVGNSGIQQLNISSTSINVYCDPGTNNASYTVIQARGPVNSSTDFGLSLDLYKQQIGTIEKNGNFWIGLDNINKITNNNIHKYNLRIDLCCGSVSKKVFHYANVTVGDSTTNYVLSGTSMDQGVGLAYGPSGISDLSATFSTPDNYTNDSTGFPKEFCDIIVDPNDSSVTWGSGGWWYGSCGNNLNGKYIPNVSGSCSNVDTTDENKIKASFTGIEMATQVQQVGNYAFDGISYDKFLGILKISLSQHTITLTLSTLKVNGILENGKNCSKFSNIGIACNPRPKICIEKLDNTTTVSESCIGSNYIDLGLLGENEVTFNTSTWYNAWFNPQDFKYDDTYNGFRIKLYIYNADFTDYEKIGFLYWDFQSTDVGGTSTPVTYTNKNTDDDKTIKEFSLVYSVITK
uniref:Fibrinogen C-terminal domain-containing protein n=1 Tax=Parastrongyloides trichosuri TaxID=131310 RepID=A0A0N5A3T1_PARTI